MEDVVEGVNFSFPKEEHKILQLWDEIDAFKTQLKITEGKPEYVFYDGPPFATGLPHYGHILAGTIKDVVTRYASTTGHHVTRRFGWDCHGLPVEYEIDKALGIKSKDDVLAMGIDKYNEACRAIVMRYSKEWETTVRRVGRWIDFENDYKTLDRPFMESVWWVFKTLHEKGLVYKGFKVMPYSTQCNTPLSNFEAGLDYRDVSDPAVMVAFPLIGDADKASLVAWTTTPWTLPTNLALCVHPDFDYVKVRSAKGEVFIVAESRLSAMPGQAKAAKAAATKEKDGAKGAAAAKGAGDKGGKAAEGKAAEGKAAEPAVAAYTVLSKMKGAELKGLRYEPLFDYYKQHADSGAFVVCCDTYVTDDSGTGIVHQAPAFGEDDFRVCMAHGVIAKGQPPPDPTDANGRYTSEVPDFKGRHVKEADRDIVAAIKAKGRLVDNGAIVHSYPFCWRSATPLIYKAVPSFFVAVEKIKDRLLVNNDKTSWVPGYVREKRFRNWLEGAHDWAVSRNRFWGTPIPVWRSADGLEEVVIGSVEELERLSGRKDILDIHRHFIDDIEIPSKRGPAFGPLRRVEDVFDCWFESGSMPYAHIHYPFENKEFFETNFPADFVAEGLDQTRGWFYTLTVLSTALFDKPAFKNLVCNGLVLAADGKKMSKSQKNYPPPEQVVEEYGADALRLYLINSPVVRAEPLRFVKEGVFAVVKDLFLKWYNAYRFLVQNARRAEMEGGAPFAPAAADLSSATNILDRWIRAANHGLIAFVRGEMAGYRLYTVAPRLVAFIENLTNTYVRFNRGRLKGKGGGADTNMALCTLYDVLLTLTKLMAPFTPFFAETMYQNLRKANPADLPASVHFCDFPQAEESAFDARIEQSVARMNTVIELARSIREKHNKPVKTPLRRLTVVHADAAFLADISGELAQYVTEEVNVRELLICAEPARYSSTRGEPNSAALGKRLGKALPAVAKAIRALSEEALAAYEASGGIAVEGQQLVAGDILIQRDFRKPEGGPACDAAGDGDVLVVLELEVDAELEAAGVAREAVSRVQKARKAAGLAAGDLVEIFWASPDAALAAVFDSHAAYMEQALGTPPLPAALRGAQHVVILRESASLSSGARLELVLCRPGLGLDRGAMAAAGRAGLAAWLPTLEAGALRARAAAGGGAVRVRMDGVEMEAKAGTDFWFTTVEWFKAQQQQRK